MKNDFTCSICNMPLDNYGYDADPINDGRCCKICSQDVVLPIQMKLVYKDFCNAMNHFTPSQSN